MANCPLGHCCWSDAEGPPDSLAGLQLSTKFLAQQSVRRKESTPFLAVMGEGIHVGRLAVDLPCSWAGWGADDGPAGSEAASAAGLPVQPPQRRRKKARPSILEACTLPCTLFSLMLR